MAIFTAFILGLLMILDPCTLMTSIAAIGYIDREMENRRRILICGGMFVIGKLVTYALLSVPFFVGAQTDWIQSVLGQYGETAMGFFLLVCGLVLLFAGHHHHEHDHGMSKWLKTVDESSYPFWAFMLGIFFAIAFCPHRLIYFFTMIDLAITQPAIAEGTTFLGITAGSLALNHLHSALCVLSFGLGTGLPILLLAWIIPYSTTNIDVLRARMVRIERYARYTFAIIFLILAAYILIHNFMHGAHVHI